VRFEYKQKTTETLSHMRGSVSSYYHGYSFKQETTLNPLACVSEPLSAEVKSVCRKLDPLAFETAGHFSDNPVSPQLMFEQRWHRIPHIKRRVFIFALKFTP